MDHKARHGVADLIPKRKEPFTREILLDTILGAPEATTVGRFKIAWGSRSGRGADPSVEVPAAPAHFCRRVQGLPLSIAPGALIPIGSLCPLSILEAIMGMALNTNGDLAMQQVNFLARGVYPALDPTAKIRFGQAQLFSMSMYTDDAHKKILSVELAVLGLRSWLRVTSSLNLTMARSSRSR